MSFLALVLSLFLHSISWEFTIITSYPLHETFTQCVSNQFRAYTKSFEIIHHSNSSSYSTLLQSSQQNPRWLNSKKAKPIYIITPFHESEIQAAIVCSKNHNLQIRVKSGGHDYEGLSFLCKTPFIIIDLINLRAIELNLHDETAWVQSGATIGELYYDIGKASEIYGFPAGLCPSVGIGGHFSGGGFGTLLRKYGIAADHIIDAYLIDVNGKILDRQKMGEDLFWAIRGGGGGSFGIILSCKIKLVRVPKRVTTFTIHKIMNQSSIRLVHKWQYIAHKLHEDIFIRIIIEDIGYGNQKMVQVSFNSLFLGGINRLIPLMKQSFPDLGLKDQDCIEMSWIQSVLYFAGYKIDQPLEVLLDRNTQYKSYFKAKSDFVNQAITEIALQGIRERFLEEELVYIIMDPFGGKMSEISENEIAFPHRKGNLYNVQYIVKWTVNEVDSSKKHLDWIREIYRYMKPYVSNSPRTAYVNYRDLDLGSNKLRKSSYEEASAWGIKYFKGNFRRLTQVKNKFDPHNFFRNEQSIPPLPEIL